MSRATSSFWYPSAVSRPYTPDPKRNFEVFQASLEASGFDVTAAHGELAPRLRLEGHRRIGGQT